MLGRLSRLHGFKGEMVLQLDVDNPASYKKLESVYVELHHELVPFFFTAFRLTPKGYAIVKLKSIDSEAQALGLKGCPVYLPLEKLPKLKGKHFYFHEIIDFTVEDRQKGTVGIVTDVYEVGGNVLLQVMREEKEILLPLHDEVLLSIDREARVLNVEAPEGLIDLYLGEGA